MGSKTSNVNLNAVSLDLWFNCITIIRVDVSDEENKSHWNGRRGITVLGKSILNGTNSVWINRASDKEGPFI